MIKIFRSLRAVLFRKTVSFFITVVFTAGMVAVPASPARAQYVSNLPKPGEMVSMSSKFDPAVLKGLTLHPDNPLKFDFLVDRGESNLPNIEFEQETQKLIKYFLAAMTIPDDKSWVNLSPYEGERIIPDMLAGTQMGKEMLEQDYLLKQLSASMTNPEQELGKKFWAKVYKRAFELYGTTDVPINTFNKVWIMPEKAVILEQEGYAFIGYSRLKVMMDEDYTSLKENSKSKAHGTETMEKDMVQKLSAVSSQIVREVIIPELEREVNEGKNFAPVRQIYNSVILAVWYKQNLKESLLGKVYADKGKLKGVDIAEKDVKEKIYAQYLEAFRRGVYNLVKEDYDLATQDMLPRKYFSGGIAVALALGDATTMTRVTLPEIRQLTEQQRAKALNRLEGIISATPRGQQEWLDGYAKYLVENLGFPAPLARDIGSYLQSAVLMPERLQEVQTWLSEQPGEMAVVAAQVDLQAVQQGPLTREQIEQQLADLMVNRSDNPRVARLLPLVDQVKYVLEVAALKRGDIQFPGTTMRLRQLTTEQNFDLNNWNDDQLDYLFGIATGIKAGVINQLSEPELSILRSGAGGWASETTPGASPEGLYDDQRVKREFPDGTWKIVGSDLGGFPSSSFIYTPSSGDTAMRQFKSVGGAYFDNNAILEIFNNAAELGRWLEGMIKTAGGMDGDGKAQFFFSIIADAGIKIPISEFEDLERSQTLGRLLALLETGDFDQVRALRTILKAASTPAERRKLFFIELSGLLLKNQNIFEQIESVFTGKKEYSSNSFDHAMPGGGMILVSFDPLKNTTVFIIKLINNSVVSHEVTGDFLAIKPLLENPKIFATAEEFKAWLGETIVNSRKINGRQNQRDFIISMALVRGFAEVDFVEATQSEAVETVIQMAQEKLGERVVKSVLKLDGADGQASKEIVITEILPMLMTEAPETIPQIASLFNAPPSRTRMEERADGAITLTYQNGATTINVTRNLVAFPIEEGDTFLPSETTWDGIDLRGLPLAGFNFASEFQEWLEGIIVVSEGVAEAQKGELIRAVLAVMTKPASFDIDADGRYLDPSINAILDRIAVMPSMTPAIQRISESAIGERPGMWANLLANMAKNDLVLFQTIVRDLGVSVQPLTVSAPIGKAGINNIDTTYVPGTLDSVIRIFMEDGSTSQEYRVNGDWRKEGVRFVEAPVMEQVVGAISIVQAREDLTSVQQKDLFNMILIAGRANDVDSALLNKVLAASVNYDAQGRVMPAVAAVKAIVDQIGDALDPIERVSIFQLQLIPAILADPSKFLLVASALSYQPGLPKRNEVREYLSAQPGGATLSAEEISGKSGVPLAEVKSLLGQYGWQENMILAEGTGNYTKQDVGIITSSVKTAQDLLNFLKGQGGQSQLSAQELSEEYQLPLELVQNTLEEAGFLEVAVGEEGELDTGLYERRAAMGSDRVTPETVAAAEGQTPYGGIDFDPTLLDLQIKRNGKGVPLPLPMQNVEQINIEGLYPVIINIQPATINNFPFLMGVTPESNSDKLSLVK